MNGIVQGLDQLRAEVFTLRSELEILKHSFANMSGNMGRRVAALERNAVQNEEIGEKLYMQQFGPRRMGW